MNIGQLLHGLFHNMPANEANVLELQVGQIVRGVVLKLLSDQEAIIGMGGAQIRAKLLTPLSVGEAAAFAVQPNRQDGMLWLKALPLSATAATAQSLVEWLNVLGVKNTSENRAVLGKLLQEEQPVSKEQFARMSEFVAAKPKNIPLNQWMDAGLLAARRGLPLSAETALPIWQVLFGEAFHQLLQAFSSQVQTILSENPRMMAVTDQTQGFAPRKAQAAAVMLPDLLRQAARMVAEIFPLRTELPSTIAMTGRETEEAVVRANSANHIIQEPRPQQGALAHPMPQQQSASAQANRRTGHPEAFLPNNMQAEHVSYPARAPIRMQTPIEPAKMSTAAAPEIRMAAHAAEIPAAQPAQIPHTAWIPQLLKLIGISFEHEGNHMPKQQMAAPEIAENPPVTQGNGAHAHDSLKGVLAQLLDNAGLAAPLKEAAQQLLNHITGQQLLLQTGTQQALSQITLFIPLRDEHGRQTASVQIQSRKGKSGLLDAQNCRLLFDLHMPALGVTVIDVAVVERMANIRIFNDHPQISSWLKESKEEIGAALAALGYSCLSLKHHNFPEQHYATASGNGKTAAIPSLRPYKGVDLRI
ncbi:MAG TPA: hypothetical protein VF260_10830 [Bacilli bacterium]